MKKVLLMTDFYSNNPSANGICIEKLAHALCEKGYGINVLAYAVGDDKEHEKIDGINIYRVKAPLFYQVREKNKGYGLIQKLFNVMRFIRFLRIVIFMPIYPLIFPCFAVKYKNMAKKIIQTNSVDIVIAEYIPIEALYASRQLKKIFPNIRFKAYVVDTFTQCPNAMNHKSIKYVSKKWENSIISELDQYFYIDNFDDYYSQAEFREYGHKMKSVGFPLVQNNSIPKRKRDNTINFLYTGSWGGERNPVGILQKLEMMEVNEVIKFIYCGKDNPIANQMNNRFKFFDLKGFIQPSELESVYLESDILINIGNSTNMIPSKLFTYISTGLPILHFYIDENDPCIKLLDKYEYSKCIDINRIDSIELKNVVEEMIDNRVEYEKICKQFPKYTVHEIAQQLVEEVRNDGD